MTVHPLTARSRSQFPEGLDGAAPERQGTLPPALPGGSLVDTEPKCRGDRRRMEARQVRTGGPGLVRSRRLASSPDNYEEGLPLTVAAAAEAQQPHHVEDDVQIFDGDRLRAFGAAPQHPVDIGRIG